MPPVQPEILAFLKLAQVNAVPLLPAFEARKAPAVVFVCQEDSQGFIQPIRKALHRRSRNGCATPTLEQGSEIVLAQKAPSLGILLLLTLQHLVVDLARFVQALVQSTALFFIGIEAEFVRLHSSSYTRLGTEWRAPFTCHL